MIIILVELLKIVKILVEFLKIGIMILLKNTFCRSCALSEKMFKFVGLIVCRTIDLWDGTHQRRYLSPLWQNLIFQLPSFEQSRIRIRMIENAFGTAGRTLLSENRLLLGKSIYIYIYILHGLQATFSVATTAINGHGQYQRRPFYRNCRRLHQSLRMKKNSVVS